MQDLVAGQHLPQKNGFLVVSHMRNQSQAMGCVPAGDKDKAHELVNNQSKFVESWGSGEILGTPGISDIIC